MLQIEKVSKTYHSKGIDYPVLKEISATIHDGEFVAIMGPSGSGKTTLLNVISGFISADGGKVILDGQDILCLLYTSRPTILSDMSPGGAAARSFRS